MSSRRLAEALGPPGEDALDDLIDDLRAAYASGPPPEAGPLLSTVLTQGVGGLAPTAERSCPPGDLTRRQPVGPGLRRHRARLALGALAASVTLVGGGAAGALPGPVQGAFERTADAVGIPLPGAGDHGESGPSGTTAADPARPATDGSQPSGADPGPAPAPPAVPPAGAGTGPDPSAPTRSPEGVPPAWAPSDPATSDVGGSPPAPAARTRAPVAPGPPDQRPPGPPAGVPAAGVGGGQSSGEDAPADGAREAPSPSGERGGDPPGGPYPSPAPRR